MLEILTQFLTILCCGMIHKNLYCSGNPLAAITMDTQNNVNCSNYHRVHFIQLMDKFIVHLQIVKLVQKFAIAPYVVDTFYVKDASINLLEMLVAVVKSSKFAHVDHA